MRVALAGFLHETNTFAPSPADLAAFRQGGGYIPLSRGAEMAAAARGVNLGISGALDVAAELGWDAVPILWTGAIPSAHVTREAFEIIADEIIAGIAGAGTLDGVFLDLHGAMVAEHLDDGEAEIARRVRDLVGPDVPVVAALDLHGNISAPFVESLDACVGFRTYPHVDMAATGAAAARLLDRIVRTGTRPAKAFRQMSYLVPIPFQTTMMAPADALYAGLDAEDAAGAWSVSLFMGFPAADIPDCGPSAVAYAATQSEADRAADRIAAAYEAAETRFDNRTFQPGAAVAEAVRLAAQATGPVVIADTQDNPGAGGVSATTGLLQALITADAQNAAIGLMVDPAAASAAHATGIGATARFRIGGHPGLPDDRPVEVEAVVETLSDGALRATGPYYGGTRLDLGPSACLRIGGVRVAVTSHIAQMADREMFRFVGIVPEEQSVLVVKSSTHFRADFAPIAAEILVACAPGPMPFNPADLPFTQLRKGLRLSPNGPAFDPAGAGAGAAQGHAEPATAIARP
ncbi:M81 family metallopeptidase [Rhodovulum sulfidophilum]|uniref:Microcystinase C n=1 Tax=Rhodovulum sulfidophilum TaxID=35806 RepID=A0ABS1RX39_RHOSU|nr:M81 family metallopeptidase [Rhodovulum sulfidophilum]MBL3610669.1 M81 family metallopeptidase [Rhodovulum sulfidophilum]MCE8456400.1 M81 family metallopeptidase [Rhodovulum sulfidophilum]